MVALHKLEGVVIAGRYRREARIVHAKSSCRRKLVEIDCELNLRP